jgi:hypothetical protein
MRWIASLIAAVCLLAAGAARDRELGEGGGESARAAKAHLDGAPAAPLALRLAAARPDAHRTTARLGALPPFAAPAVSTAPPAPHGSPYRVPGRVVASADQARPACSSRGPPRG